MSLNERSPLRYHFSAVLGPTPNTLVNSWQETRWGRNQEDMLRNNRLFIEEVSIQSFEELYVLKGEQMQIIFTVVSKHQNRESKWTTELFSIYWPLVFETFHQRVFSRLQTSGHIEGSPAKRKRWLDDIFKENTVGVSSSMFSTQFLFHQQLTNGPNCCAFENSFHLNQVSSFPFLFKK